PPSWLSGLQAPSRHAGGTLRSASSLTPSPHPCAMETATVAQTLQGGRTPFSSAARRWRFAAAHASPPPTQRPLPNCAGLRIEQTCDADWPMQLLPRLGQAGDA